jgi:type VI secretion system protein ImpG
LQWRLISHLALNSLSLVETAGPLREILKLYNFSDHPGTAETIAGIMSIKSQPQLTRMLTSAGVAFSQGMRVQIEFDEDRFTSSGVFLMASVLERFLGLYTSINSFTQLTATTRQRKEKLRAWKPRAGEQILA